MTAPPADTPAVGAPQAAGTAQVDGLLPAQIGSPALPPPRGPVSAGLLAALRRPPHPLPDSLAGRVRAGGGDPVTDEDLQLSLHLCYELHYRGWAGVDDGWEWVPSLLALRAELEGRLERGLRALVPWPKPVSAAELPRTLAALAAVDVGPSLGRHLRRRSSLEQFREFVVHRSVYHLKEADPHTFGIPRLAGRPKAALVEIQADEYGGGQLGRMHSVLFATTMRELGLDDSYGAYLPVVPATTLATGTLMSLFGLHRRWLPALLGHLAVLEMTSSLPNRQYGDGLRRLGFGSAATLFYDEHVEADAVHEQVAAHDLCGAFVADQPEAAATVLFGAACCLAVDARASAHLLDRWAAGAGSLRPAAAGAVPDVAGGRDAIPA